MKKLIVKILLLLTLIACCLALWVGCDNSETPPTAPPSTEQGGGDRDGDQSGDQSGDQGGGDQDGGSQNPGDGSVEFPLLPLP